jgi:hypothetical protein
LCKIAKTLASGKSTPDVVDYHFRFKIPDQFWQRQEKKREIAFRIVECMEEKRAYQPSANISSSTSEQPQPTTRNEEGGPSRVGSQRQHWSETSVHEVATLTDARRRKAQELMLDVQEQLGQEALAHMAQIIPKEKVRRYSLFCQKHENIFFPLLCMLFTLARRYSILFRSGCCVIIMNNLLCDY